MLGVHQAIHILGDALQDLGEQLGSLDPRDDGGGRALELVVDRQHRHQNERGNDDGHQDFGQSQAPAVAIRGKHATVPSRSIVASWHP